MYDNIKWITIQNADRLNREITIKRNLEDIISGFSVDVELSDLIETIRRHRDYGNAFYCIPETPFGSEQIPPYAHQQFGSKPHILKINVYNLGNDYLLEFAVTLHSTFGVAAFDLSDKAALSIEVPEKNPIPVPLIATPPNTGINIGKISYSEIGSSYFTAKLKPKEAA